MPWRGVAPIQWVILIVGATLLSSTLGMVVLALVAAVNSTKVVIPQELATVAISSLTALGGLLVPHTGLTTSGRTARHAAMAGHAAAAAVVEHEGLVDVAREARDL
jgi:hypothetical protein